MPLNKDVLGEALYESEKQFNDKSAEELGNIEDARLLFWTIQADEIIKHFQLNADVQTAGTAAAQTGKIY